MDSRELLVLTCEHLPCRAGDYVWPLQAPPLLADSEVLMQAHVVLQAQAAGASGIVEDSTRLFCALKDLRTLLRMLAAMSSVFADAFEQSLGSATALLSKILELTDYVRQHALQRHGPQFNKLYEIFPLHELTKRNQKTHHVSPA